MGKKNNKVMEIEVEYEPASPATRLFHTKTLNCYIIDILGCTTSINRGAIKKVLECTLLNHPRFSSISDMDSLDEFLENYSSNLTAIPMDMTKPLWEVHILNIKTSEANGVEIVKLHHSIGDGMSIVSLVLACTRKASNLEELPTLSSSKEKKKKDDVGF